MLVAILLFEGCSRARLTSLLQMLPARSVSLELCAMLFQVLSKRVFLSDESQAFGKGIDGRS